MEQSEKPRGKSALETINEKKVDNCNYGEHIDKIEPKFKIDDWIVNKENAYLIGHIDYEQRRYLFEIGGYTHEQLNWEYIENVDNKYHLWTIKDAKDGDILCCNQIILLFKHWEYNTDCNYVIAHAGIDVSGKLQITNSHWLISKESKPATKEQRDLLFLKMKESGYVWDEEKKELKKIEQKCGWSEDDEKMYNKAIKCIKQSYYNEKIVIDWLKDIKERVQHHNTWKPSDEQIKGIECAIKTLRHKLNVGDKRLNSLYNDLKKLMEE